MSTDPREFEHPIDGTGGNMTAPDMVELGAMALFDDYPVWHLVHDRPALWSEVVESAKERYRHQARAVLAAIEQAGSVEWGVRRVGYPAVRQHSGEGSARWTVEECALEGHPEQVVSRITGPWTAAT